MTKCKLQKNVDMTTCKHYKIQIAKIQMEQNTIRIKYKENKIQKGTTYKGKKYNLDKIQKD